MKRRAFLTILGLLPLGIGYEPNGAKRPAWYDRAVKIGADINRHRSGTVIGVDMAQAGSDRTVGAITANGQIVSYGDVDGFARKAIRR